MSNYSLDIISHLPQFSGKSLKKYYVDGIETVGAWGNEPFEIRFKNNTWQKVQVKISVDGTDVFTGKPADTDVGSEMWVVEGYGTLSLKAWPENNHGGAAFVFTSANNSVAIHTHGDLSNRGIIAAAVYTEGHVEPIKYNPYILTTYLPSYTLPGVYINTYSGTVLSSNNSGSSSGTSSSISNYVDTNTYGASLDCLHEARNICDSDPVAAGAADNMRMKSLQSLAAVGAGQHVDQQITYVTGLIKPVFSESVRVRYIWWDDLVASLRKNNVPSPHPNGFPGDNHKHDHIDLGKTPRLPTYGTFSRGSIRRSYEPVYDRV